MILNRLFKSKWTRSEPDMRREAVQSLAADDPQRRRVACEDSDPGKRRAALAQLTDLELLRRISHDDNDAGVRAFAQARFRKLLSGQADDSPELSQRLALLNGPQPLAAELAEQLSRQGVEPELRLAALQWVQQEQRCAEVAIHDPVAKVRSAALERIQTPAMLEQIARRTRQRDKRISRGARERLQTLNAERDRQRRIEQLCQDMEALQWDSETGPAAARFAQLEVAWQALAATANEAQQQRFQQAHDKFAEHFRASAAKRSARTALCEQLSAQLEVLREPQGDVSDDEIATQLARIRDQWQALGPLEQAGSQRLQEQFDELYGHCEQLLTQRQRDLQYCSGLNRVIDEARSLMGRSGQVLDHEVSALQRQWKHQPQPQASHLHRPLQDRFAQALAQLQQRLVQQNERKAEELQQMEQLLETLQRALEHGELARAIDCQHQAEVLLADNIGLSRQQMSDFASRLQVLQPRIAELRGWRRWGTNRSRESLIEEVESLPGNELEVPELAQRIQAARATWKEMDSTAGGAPRALWKRFDRACEQAYAPVRAHQQAQAEQRQRNLEQGEALCQELEQLVASTDWSGQPDWRELSRASQRFQQRWRQLGPIERRQRKRLERRFQTAHESLQQQLRPQLERDLARRRDLIGQAQALLDSADSRAAVDEVKRLQQRWQPQVLGSRRQEQALWKSFRSACDQVFERRQAEREAHANRRQANLEQCQAITAAINELSEHIGADPQASNERYQALRADWQAIGEIPRRAQRDCEQQFRDACRRFEQGRQRQRYSAIRGQLERLAARAELCGRAEALLANAPEAALIAELESAWAAAPEVDAAAQEILQQRFTRACQALRQDAAARQTLLAKLSTGRAAKRELCLQLEIATGVETPHQYAQERMQYQVARLSDSLAGRGQHAPPGDNLQQAVELARQWLLTPLPAAADDAQLEARFANAYAALQAQLG